MANKKTYTLYALILVLVFIIAGAAGSYLGNALIHHKKSDKVEEPGKIVSSEKATIMIMGVDTRRDDVGRSDTLMLATVDPENDKVSLFSIPRDTRVKIPHNGYDKINAAYAYGGRKLTQETVENLLNTHIDHYVKINIQGFVKIIDALGGIDINVEKRMYYTDPYDDNGGLYIDLHPGMQHMDGKTAITYVRYRDSEGDIGRIRRQQKFMQAVMEKMVSPSIIIKLPSIISAVKDSIDTDMSPTEILSFITTLKEAKSKGFNAQMLPGTPAYIEGISYWLPNIKKARAMLANDLGITMSDDISNSTNADDEEYQQSIPEDTVEISDSERVKYQLEDDKQEYLETKPKQHTQSTQDIPKRHKSDDTLATPHRDGIDRDNSDAVNNVPARETPAPVHRDKEKTVPAKVVPERDASDNMVPER